VGWNSIETITPPAIFYWPGCRQRVFRHVEAAGFQPACDQYGKPPHRGQTRQGPLRSITRRQNTTKVNPVMSRCPYPGRRWRKPPSEALGTMFQRRPASQRSRTREGLDG
jgi:hypothetical protein